MGSISMFLCSPVNIIGRSDIKSLTVQGGSRLLQKDVVGHQFYLVTLNVIPIILSVSMNIMKGLICLQEWKNGNGFCSKADIFLESCLRN